MKQIWWCCLFPFPSFLIISSFFRFKQKGLVHNVVLVCSFYFYQTFNPNPYFENTKLTKTFTFREEGTTEITATPIKWKEGMVKVFVFALFWYHFCPFLLYMLISLFLWNMKGLPNGVNHGNKGSKRPLPDERLTSSIWWKNIVWSFANSIKLKCPLPLVTLFMLNFEHPVYWKDNSSSKW